MRIIDKTEDEFTTNWRFATDKVYGAESASQLIDQMRSSPLFQVESLILWSCISGATGMDITPLTYRNELMSLLGRQHADMIIFGGSYNDTRATFAIDMWEKVISITMMNRVTNKLGEIVEFLEQVERKMSENVMQFA